MIKKFNLIYSLLVFVIASSAQPGADEEHSFIHTDKILYPAGDRLFFSVAIVSPTNSGLSVIGYAELYTNNGELLTRHKLKFDSGKSYGNFDLPAHLPTGLYHLQTYTLWMKISSRKI